MSPAWSTGSRSLSSSTAAGAPAASASPLYVAAMPGQGWVLYDIPYADAFWEGAVDNLRLSRGARYREDFDPPERLLHDAATVFTLPCDQRFGDFVPATGEPALHAEVEGNANLVHEDR
jgi:hypothetical protein